MPQSKRVLAWALLTALVCAPPAAWAQAPADPLGRGHPNTKEFKCSTGSISVRIETAAHGLVAFVYPENGSFTLPVAPWVVGEEPRVRWTDGVRTLTWSPGPELRWNDGRRERVCVNGVTHHRDAAADAETAPESDR